ncbi:MAG: hypothetical protein ABIP94_06205, partial [Planctomycetota bacterium]
MVDRGEKGLELNMHGAPAVLDALRSAFPVVAGKASNPATALLQRALAPEQLDLALEQIDFDFDAFLRGLDDMAVSRRADMAARALARSRVAMAMVEPQRVVLVGHQNAGKSTLFN